MQENWTNYSFFLQKIWIFEKKSVNLYYFFCENMRLYFWILRLAAWLGHRKASLLVAGQDETIRLIAGREDLQGCVWIHAASVGEFEQARPLIEQIRKRQPDQKIVLTFFSPSGYEMRKHYDQVDAVFYLPFATNENARLWLDAIRPKMAIFVKYEFWPAYLKNLSKRCIPTYLICGIFQPKQLFFRWYGRSYRRLLNCFTRLFVQDQKSVRLLTEHGIEQCKACGDTRFDRVGQVMKARRDIPLVREFTKDAEQVLIAGSTWPEDEVLLADYIHRHPETKVVIVPHEVTEEHLNLLFHLMRGRMCRYTEINEQLVIKPQVLVVDTIGLLSSIYQYGHVAYIGGGFGAGIHNTIEAAVYGIPVLFGPKYRPFREARDLIRHNAAVSIRDSKTLEAALERAFAEQLFMGTAAAEYCRAEIGATDAIYKELFH